MKISTWKFMEKRNFVLTLYLMYRIYVDENNYNAIALPILKEKKCVFLSPLQACMMANEVFVHCDVK